MLDVNTITTCLVTILSVLITVLYWYFKNIYNYWKEKNVPYLQPIIPFGNALNVILRKWTLGQAFGEVYLKFKKMGVRHGGMYVLNKPVYIPVDPDIIKRILISDADNFPNHGFYLNPEGDPLSTHLFNMEGNRWKDLRTKLPQAFTSARMRKMFDLIVKLSEEFQHRLDCCRAKNPDGVEMKTELSLFTTDVTSLCAFGFESNTMKNKNDELMKHGRQFFDYQWNIYKNSMLLALPRHILKKINFRIFTKETTHFVRNMFNDLKKYRKEGNIQRDDLANIILRLTEENEELKDYSGKNVMTPLNENEYIAQMWVFFSASFETSSSTITFALYELSKNLECQRKLREEIRTVLAQHDGKLTYDAVMEMKYLNGVLDETLRIYPVFPIVPRVCKEDYKVPGTDFVLEKNTFVLVSNYGLQRDPEYYPDPLKFDPERFYPENKGTRPFVANLPFGEGPRICIGKRFGLMQSKVAVISIIKNYEVTLSDKTKPGVSFDPWKLVLRKSGDVWVNLKKIES